MSSARDDILSNIRRSLGVTGQEAPRRFAVNDRLTQSPTGVIPARGQIDGTARIAMFREQAEAVSASVALVEAAQDAPAEIARYLRENNLPATLRRGEDARLSAMDWGGAGLEISVGPSDGDDLNGVSHAFGGVAETGTLVMISGAENPTTLNFLPDNHFVILAATDLERDMESIWDRLRGRFGKALMPRTVNMITGPSRSADIEQTLLLGAHGPRRLHVVIVSG